MKHECRFPFASACGGKHLICCQKVCFSEITGMRNLVSIFFKLLLRPWGLSHRVERQKLMVKKREEMVGRVQKGCFMAKLLQYYHIHIIMAIII